MNKTLNTYIVVLTMVLGIVACGPQASKTGDSPNVSRNYEFEDAATMAVVDSIFAGMTLDDKVMQLIGIRSDELCDENGKLDTAKCREKIPHGIGHICQFAYSMPGDVTAEGLHSFVTDLQRWLTTATHAQIPAIVHEEAISGFCAFGATTYPQAVGTACTWNPELMQAKAELTAKAMRSVGCVFALSPMLDVCKTAWFERMEEGLGEDGYLAARMGLAFVEGMHCGDISKGVETTGKHFAGYAGGTDTDKEFFEEVLMPFEAAIRLGGTKSIMPGYHKFRGTQCIGNKYLLTDVLRNYIGFDGIIVSDYYAIGRLPNDWREDAVQAMNAGADVELPNHTECFPHLPDILAKGEISMERFETSVKRELAMKVRLGLFDKSKPLVPAEAPQFDTPEERKMAYDVAVQSVVVMKNDGVLPLDGKTKKIALVGPNADAGQALCGDYSFQSMIGYGKRVANISTPHLVTLREGLEKKMPAENLRYERGCDWFADDPGITAKENEDPERVPVKYRVLRSMTPTTAEAAMKIISESDVVVAGMGENLWLSGEGRQRNVYLPDLQVAFLREVVKAGKPLVLIIFGGRPQVITEFEPHCAAIIQAWYPGEEGGNAVADILLGNANPSAKLCMSYPKVELKKNFGYRYGYNSNDNDPLYPFGHGLSYTTFDFEDLKIADRATTADERIEVSFTLKNTGKRAGAETAQLYITPKDQTDKVITLRGFKRVKLNAGESRTITMRLSPQLFAHYDNGKWLIEPGRYDIRIGSSSKDLKLERELTLTGEKIEMARREVFFSE